MIGCRSAPPSGSGAWEGYNHKDSPKEKHENEVSLAATEGTLLQHAAVPEPMESV